MTNRLLESFPVDVLAFVRPHLTRMRLGAEAQLGAPGQPAQYVYFPTTSVVAVRHEVVPGEHRVLGLIDRNGMAGISALIGPDTTNAVVLVAGDALRLAAGHLRGEFDRSASLRQLLLGWIQGLMAQVIQACICQRHHEPVARLCFRLMQLTNPGEDSDVRLTQQQLGEVLGMRRERVNAILGELQAQGLISRQRGLIELKAPDRISAKACACQAAWAEARSRLCPGRG